MVVTFWSQCHTANSPYRTVPCQVMDWCSRQGLAGAGPGRAVHGGRYGTYAEWCGVVSQRRTRAAPRPLFLDTLLEVRGRVCVNVCAAPLGSRENARKPCHRAATGRRCWLYGKHSACTACGGVGLGTVWVRSSVLARQGLCPAGGWGTKSGMRWGRTAHGHGCQAWGRSKRG